MYHRAPLRLGLVACLFWVASCGTSSNDPADLQTDGTPMDQRVQEVDSFEDISDVTSDLPLDLELTDLPTDEDGSELDLLAELEVADLPDLTDLPDVSPDVPVELDLTDLEDSPDLTDALDLLPDTPDDLTEVEEIQPDLEDVEADVPFPPASPIAINEFRVSPTSQEAIELYNRLEGPVYVGEWSLTIVSDQVKVWFLPELVMPANGHLVLTKDNLVPADGITFTSIFPNAGAVLTLSDEDGNVVEEVGYGTRGPAPLPTYGTSTARIEDGIHTGHVGTDFNWDRSPTFDAPNNPAGIAVDPPTIQVNELLAKPASSQGYIEFKVLTEGSLDVSGWILVFSGEGASDQQTWPDEQEWTGYQVVEETSLPTYAQFDDNGVVYLYNPIGVRMMQLGWDNLPLDGSHGLGYPPGETVPLFCYDTETCGLVPMYSTKGFENLEIEE